MEDSICGLLLPVILDAVSEQLNSVSEWSGSSIIIGQETFTSYKKKSNKKISNKDKIVQFLKELKDIRVKHTLSRA